MKKSKTNKKKIAAKNVLQGSRVKIKFRNHILPPLAGLLAFALVFGFFNSEPLSARIAYQIYSSRKEAAIYEPDTRLPDEPVNINALPLVQIDKINVNAPVVYDQKIINESAFQLALQRGVVHYPGTALPGKKGNVVIFGHSSSPWWAKGDYKFVFTLLDQLVIDDLIYMDYEGVRYTYRIHNTFIVPPTDTSVLNQNDSHILTLITCSPVGSNTKRLIIQATQVDPVVETPAELVEPVTLPDEADGRDLPSSSSGFWQNLLQLF